MIKAFFSCLNLFEMHYRTIENLLSHRDRVFLDKLKLLLRIIVAFLEKHVVQSFQWTYPHSIVNFKKLCDQLDSDFQDVTLHFYYLFLT